MVGRCCAKVLALSMAALGYRLVVKMESLEAEQVVGRMFKVLDVGGGDI